jgi:hypothetical protein
MAMKRLQIMIEPELDAALGREARRTRTSKGALIRRYVQERLKPLPPITEDPLWEMVGAAGNVGPLGDIDEIVYGGKTRRRP